MLKELEECLSTSLILVLSQLKCDQVLLMLQYIEFTELIILCLCACYKATDMTLPYALY